MSILDKLYYDLQTYEPEVRDIETMTPLDKNKTFLFKLTQTFKGKQPKKEFVERPKSLYIYGGAGCGKVFILISIFLSRDDRH